MFYPKEVPNLVSAIRIRIDLCFSIANNVVPVEDIREMYNIDDMLTEAVMYDKKFGSIALNGLSKFFWVFCMS